MPLLRLIISRKIFGSTLKGAWYAVEKEENDHEAWLTKINASIEILIPYLSLISDGQVIQLDEEILKKMPIIEYKVKVVEK